MSIPSKRVAVIGAGISGVVAAAHLRKEDIDVTVFERSSEAGGVWYQSISFYTILQALNYQQAVRQEKAIRSNISRNIHIKY